MKSPCHHHDRTLLPHTPTMGIVILIPIVMVSGEDVGAMGLAVDWINTNKELTMYTAEISRTNPALILFLFDCSYSMSEQYGTAKMSKGQFLANICNESIDQIILSCEKGDEIRAYFEIGIL
ncbi:MAG: hypothetical protein OEZ36_06565, partial [Spirochaetota bacterium]|nr:hypothetical protein [Spirochaetota bacterium]